MTGSSDLHGIRRIARAGPGAEEETVMATMDVAGFLPTIKCSSCNLDVEISAMGEHICAAARECMSHSFVPP